MFAALLACFLVSCKAAVKSVPSEPADSVPDVAKPSFHSSLRSLGVYVSVSKDQWNNAAAIYVAGLIHSRAFLLA